VIELKKENEVQQKAYQSQSLLIEEFRKEIDDLKK
jgi:hypothetical protein